MKLKKMNNSKKIENKSVSDGLSHKQSAATPKADPKEIGGPKGPEPTRYGDWEKKGRCIDF